VRSQQDLGLSSTRLFGASLCSFYIFHFSFFIRIKALLTVKGLKLNLSEPINKTIT
jgi:hypothetical protein